MSNTPNDTPRRGGSPGENLEPELQALLGPPARFAEARLRRIRSGVFTQLAQPAAALPRWLRWRLALPAALSLLLLGGALGWNVEPRVADAQDLGLFSAVLMAASGETE